MKSKHSTESKCATTPCFSPSPINAAVKVALLATGILTGISHANATTPVEAAGDSRFNIESIINSDNTMTVTQNDQVAWVKWDTYNIGEDNTVAYNYTEGGSAFHALNFVLGTEVSSIQGNITSDGNVYIYNANGIVFSNNAIINVAGLLASTQAPTSDSIDSIASQISSGGDSISLDVLLSGETGDGAIEINDAASITSTLNDITFIAETISATDSNTDGIDDTVNIDSQGSVNLYANNRSTVTIDLSSDLFSVEVTEKLDSEPGQSLIDMQNSQIVAQVGVNISALSAQALTLNAVNTTGIVQADSVTIDADGNVVLGDINATSSLTATVAQGDISDSGTINTASATFNMNDATEANITLDSQDNDIFILSAFGDNINDITINDTFGIVLNGIEANTLTLNTSGDVLQSDVFYINDVFITAAQQDARFNIYLDWIPDDGVTFNQVDYFGAVGHNVYLVDASGVELTGISASDDFVLSTDGTISQSGTLDVLDQSFIYAVDADNVGYNIILEDDFNELGTLHAAGNNISVTDAQNLVLGDIEVATSFLATVWSGDITDTGTIQAPMATFNALDNTQANILLNSIDNDIEVFAAIGDNINEIHLVDNFGVILDGVQAKMFTLDTTGEVSQSDVLTIDDAFISAADGDTTFDINLNLVLDDNQTFNQIGALGAIGNNIQLIDSNGVLLTGITATQDLMILTDGDITQNYALDVTGSTILSALNNNGTGFNILLDASQNNLGTFNAVADTIVVVDGFGLELGDIDVATSLTATTLSGNITDTGVILAPELDLFAQHQADGSDGNITLDSLDNQFGVVTATGNNINLYHASDLLLGNINATSSLTATVAQGDINQASNSILSTDSLTLNLSDGAILNLANNNIANAVDIFADGSLTIEQLRLNSTNNGSVAVDVRGNLAINNIDAQTSDISLSAQQDITTANANSESGAVTGQNVAAKAARHISLNSIVAGEDVELIAFGDGVEDGNIAISVTNPVIAGGTVGYGVTEEATASLSSEQPILTYTITGDYSADASLGLIDGDNPSQGITPDFQPPEPEPEPELENEKAVDFYAVGLQSMSLPASKEAITEVGAGFAVPSHPIKLPDNQHGALSHARDAGVERHESAESGR